MKYDIDVGNPQELPNKTLLFQIHDENDTLAGYAIASAIDSFDICGTNLNSLSNFSPDNEFIALKYDIERFCKVYYHGSSDKTTES